MFGFIADGLNGPKWQTGILHIAHVSGSGVGSTYKQGVKGPGGRRINADYRITTYEPNSRLAFEAIAGPVRPAGEYLLEEVDGGTRLTFTLNAELGGIKRFFMGERSKDDGLGGRSDGTPQGPPRIDARELIPRCRPLPTSPSTGPMTRETRNVRSPLPRWTKPIATWSSAVSPPRTEVTSPPSLLVASSRAADRIGGRG